MKDLIIGSMMTLIGIILMQQPTDAVTFVLAACGAILALGLIAGFYWGYETRDNKGP